MVGVSSLNCAFLFIYDSQFVVVIVIVFLGFISHCAHILLK